ncbi:FMRFamide receptor-like [Elysia marginata]|uniref:FMRFamide receptor-like n=1 Tax=Elysia marginata TaxID=1093978 RepID=A0AAV4JCU6_9GAST|nr:FMRFamide receptor-like [Elysia marginata]
MDRYVSVCYPSRSKAICTIPRARTVVTAVFLIMMLLSIPSVFRYRLQTIHDTSTNQTCMELVVTELGRNQQFMIPYTWVQNFLRGIIPVFILVFLNARIIQALWKERVKGKKFSSRNRITLMLIAMVVIFIVCITPDAIMSTFFGKGYVEEDYLVKGIREITDALVAFNSAVNFLLYCSLSAVFRNTFTRVFFGRRYAKINRFGSNRNISRDGTSGGTSFKRQKSQRDWKGKSGRKKERWGEKEEEEEVEDLMLNGGDPMATSPCSPVVPSCENGDCLNLSCPNHVCIDLQTRSTSPGSGSADYSNGTKTRCSDGTSQSSGSSTAADVKKKRNTSSLLCAKYRAQREEGKNKKAASEQPKLYNNKRCAKDKDKNGAKLGSSKDQLRKPSFNLDMSYLTSTVYLGPTTEVLPFEISRRNNSATSHPLS